MCYLDDVSLALGNRIGDALSVRNERNARAAASAEDAHCARKLSGSDA